MYSFKCLSILTVTKIGDCDLWPRARLQIKKIEEEFAPKSWKAQAVRERLELKTKTKNNNKLQHNNNNKKSRADFAGQLCFLSLFFTPCITFFALVSR